MPISIRNPRVELLARRLAVQTGLSMTETIVQSLQALEETLQKDSGSLRTQLCVIAARCSALPDLDTRSAEDILGYGDAGVNP